MSYIILNEWYANRTNPKDLIFFSPHGEIYTGKDSPLKGTNPHEAPKEFNENYERIENLNTHFLRLTHEDIRFVLESQLAQMANDNSENERSSPPK